MPPAPRPDAQALNSRIVACESCPRLRSHCREVARVKRRAYAEQDYWGRPVPTTLPVGGARAVRLWIVGLAPAAHGANRTGRMFTGDRSGDFLYAALHRAGFASAPASVARGDGTRLAHCAISAAVRCAPPGNRPLPREVARCRAWLDAEWELFRGARVVLALGGLAHAECVRLFRRQGALPPGPAVRFFHGVESCHDRAPGGRALLGSYHVSQQNTFTGRLTEPMLDTVLDRAVQISQSR